VFDPEQLIDEIVAFSGIKKIWVAYSGGVDSHVLLHALATSQQRLPSLHAVHINHNLHKNSADWAECCAHNAKILNVDFISLSVAVDGSDGGVEAAARTARYQALRSLITEGELLVTAQHQEDQAETLLLQLLRGAGPKGLSGMPKQTAFSEGNLMRPLLAVSQAEILDYARQHNLQWVEDPSNLETRWNRNYLRHKIWPQIVARWPSAARTISRSARHCAETTELLAVLAEQDLVNIDVDKTADSLPVSGILSLSDIRCRNLLRYWVEKKGFRLPSTDQLQRVISEVCLASEDSSPILAWEGVEVRRYQGRLYFHSPLKPHDREKFFYWQGKERLDLDDGRSVLWQQRQGDGLAQSLLEHGVTIRFRIGGERIQLHGHHHHKSLKHLFQEWKIPPWERDRIPLIYSGENLIAITGHAVDESFAVASDETGYFPVLNAMY